MVTNVLGRASAIASAAVLAIAVTACGAVADPQQVLDPSSIQNPAAESDVGRTSTSAPATSIQQIVDNFRTAKHIVGLSLAVVKPGPDEGTPQVDYYMSGSPSVDSPEQVTPQTQFEIGSQTKTFTAAMLAKLIEDGKVTLDDPLQHYAPAGITVPTYTTPSGTVVPITLRDLATHQSGLPDMPANFEAGCPGGVQCADDAQLYTRDLMWQGLTQTTLSWQPGTTWLYSNFAYAILGTVLADLVEPGQQTPPYQDAVASQLLTSLPMPSTSLEVPGNQIATGYSLNGAQPIQQPYYLDANAYAGEGGMVSNATDMATWSAAALGFQVGSSADSDRPLLDSLQVISDPTQFCSAPGDCTLEPRQMGLGWELYASGTDVPMPYWFKNGETNGFYSVTVLIPTKKIAVTVLSNTVIPETVNPLAMQVLGQTLDQQH